MIEEKDEIQLDEIKIGKFKPKRKFLNFVQGRKSNIRFISNFAYIRGKQLSGVLEDVIFKVTIQSEGTIDFEEVDTNLCDEDTIKRLIDDIDSKDVTGYMHKYVVYGLDFEDEDGKKFYLEVEEEKPINKLFNLFNEIENEEMDIEVSENANSILDELFSSETEEETQREFEGESDEEIQKERELSQNTEVEKPKSFIELQFDKLNLDKIEEISSRIEKKYKEIQKLKFDIKQGEQSLKKSIHEHVILNSRLESLKPKEDPNGYVFFVSEENKTGIEESDEVKSVVEKISPILNLNAPVVMDMITKGYYTIKISEKSDLKLEGVLYNKDIHEKISKIDIDGKIKIVTPGEYEYRGELNWHQLVDKLIKLGFEQEPEFDKMCGSNSYQSNVEDDITDTKDFSTVEEKGTFENIESKSFKLKIDKIKG